MKRTVKCHCGDVELEVTPSQPLSQAVRCDCSFCKRRAAATVSVPQAYLKIVKGHEALSMYQWNTGTAEHYFCRNCGTYTHHRKRINPKEFGVNLGAIEGVTAKELYGPGWVDGVNHPSDA